MGELAADMRAGAGRFGHHAVRKFPALLISAPFTGLRPPQAGIDQGF